MSRQAVGAHAGITLVGVTQPHGNKQAGALLLIWEQSTFTWIILSTLAI
jgi:hypothetical protein